MVTPLIWPPYYYCHFILVRTKVQSFITGACWWPDQWGSTVVLTFYTEITYISTEDLACEQSHSGRYDTCYSTQVYWSISGATVNKQCHIYKIGIVPKDYLDQKNLKRTSNRIQSCSSCRFTWINRCLSSSNQSKTQVAASPVANCSDTANSWKENSNSQLCIILPDVDHHLVFAVDR